MPTFKSQSSRRSQLLAKQSKETIDGRVQIELIDPYKIRALFKTILYDDASRFIVAVIHRKGGKSYALANFMVDKMLSSQLTLPVGFFVFPTASQGMMVVWDMFKQVCRYLTDVDENLVSFSKKDNKITFAHNGAVIYIRGAEKPDNLRGPYADLIIFDEYQHIDPYTFHGVMRPMVSTPGRPFGRVIFSGTPFGKGPLYKMFQNGLKTDTAWSNWKSHIYTINDTKLLPDSELLQLRAEMADIPGLFDQEYLCSFDIEPVGAFYATILNQLEKDRKIGEFPYNPKYGVITSWDIGVNDYTVVWFAQQIEGRVRIIDHHKSHNQPDFEKFYITMLKDKGYNYVTHILPFDSKSRHSGAGKTVWQLLQESFPGTPKEAKRVTKRLEGIRQAQALLHICEFNAGPTLEGRDALFQYRSEYDESKGVQKQEPLKDWTWHDADSFRYLAVGLTKTPKKFLDRAKEILEEYDPWAALKRKDSSSKDPLEWLTKDNYEI